MGGASGNAPKVGRTCATPAPRVQVNTAGAWPPTKWRLTPPHLCRQGLNFIPLSVGYSWAKKRTTSLTLFWQSFLRSRKVQEYFFVSLHRLLPNSLICQKKDFELSPRQLQRDCPFPLMKGKTNPIANYPLICQVHKSKKERFLYQIFFSSPKSRSCTINFSIDKAASKTFCNSTPGSPSKGLLTRQTNSVNLSALKLKRIYKMAAINSLLPVKSLSVIKLTRC